MGLLRRFLEMPWSLVVRDDDVAILRMCGQTDLTGISGANEQMSSTRTEHG